VEIFTDSKFLLSYLTSLNCRRQYCYWCI